MYVVPGCSVHEDSRVTCYLLSKLNDLTFLKKQNKNLHKLPYLTRQLPYTCSNHSFRLRIFDFYATFHVSEYDVGLELVSLRS